MREHWEKVYREKAPEAVSWHRPHLDVSLALLEQAGLAPASRVIDVGGGASTLVDDLVLRGIGDITVLDLAQSALDAARYRVDSPAVTWLCADVTAVELPAGHFTHWHDRAVLHFLAQPAQIAAYARQAANAVAPGGHAVIGGFAPDGPEKCSGLPVVRRTAAEIVTAMGPAFALVAQRKELHYTPWQSSQSFVYALLRRR